ncbi:hypothetical protein FDP08_02760 [Marinobacter panjinensis]|uniref:Uncharacterized protein n=1 Tax=Marinobacter panjinensis TaxID=2576384 RepID=A0A4U6R456_9GAMM|nr:hypothetical protein [Marinobacter panjinensis]MCR8915947.1 hypothetical protein [Marinobacter panjinensis]TKV67086.1 hypothetical protein FDP08_02760 [Marinobacter panjinensis]
MKRMVVFFAFSLPVLTTMAAEVRFTGEATAKSDDKVIYEERHLVEGECSDGLFYPATQTVTYVRAGGNEFASKTLSYDESQLRPTVDFRQPEFNEAMDITNPNDDELTIEWRTPDGNTESFSVEVTDTLVADAGFDHLVRQNWAAVTSGDSVEFDFLAPTRGKAYGFVLEPAGDNRIDAAYTVRIKPSGVILGFLVDPILLGYNEEGMLTDYIGLTNIRKDRDTNYTAHIRYTVETTPDCELTR